MGCSGKPKEKPWISPEGIKLAEFQQKSHNIPDSVIPIKSLCVGATNSGHSAAVYFVLMYDGTVYRSTNLTSWTDHTSTIGAGAGYVIQQVVSCPHSPEVIGALAWNSTANYAKFCYTINGGASWTAGSPGDYQKVPYLQPNDGDSWGGHTMVIAHENYFIFPTSSGLIGRWKRDTDTWYYTGPGGNEKRTCSAVGPYSGGQKIWMGDVGDGGVGFQGSDGGFSVGDGTGSSWSVYDTGGGYEISRWKTRMLWDARLDRYVVIEEDRTSYRDSSMESSSGWTTHHFDNNIVVVTGACAFNTIDTTTAVDLPTLFLISGVENVTPTIWASKDGSSWYKQTPLCTGLDTTFHFHKIEYDAINDRFILVGVEYNTPSPRTIGVFVTTKYNKQ